MRLLALLVLASIGVGPLPAWAPDIGQATQGLLSIIPAAERPKTVAIFQEKTDWGQPAASTM